MLTAPTMIKLHIRQNDPVEGSYPVRLTLRRDNQPDLEAEAKIEFALTEQEQNDLRWYLEDYLQQSGDAESIVAQQVESIVVARGEELYQKVLAVNENTRALWYSIRNDVANLRVEVSTGVAEAASIPWELMRDPILKSPISLRVKSFVRVQSNPNISFVAIPPAADGRVRLLYIASRPGGASDVELRAVANRLVRDLGQDRSRFDIKALRPPTFEQLQKELNDASENNRPYHLVHFDGHGTYEDLSQTKLAHWVSALSNGDDKRARGYLLFEHPGEDGVRPIDGETLGKLLHDCGVPVLVLNACQSAMQDTRYQDTSALDVHDEVRAIGSLSQAVIDQGVPAVLGMRYSVFVVTAAQYIGQLYAALAKGRGFGQAATEGRKHLQLNPERWVGLEPRPLQDWFVPIVYEAAPIALLSAQQSISLGDQTELDPVQNNHTLLRYVPEEGFIGRDETLLALDRAFDEQRVVLLHAYAGQGKSATAVEFARWYALTGGLGERPVVLLASFEGHTDLDDLLNQIGQTFSPLLEAQNVHWSAINDPQKRRNVVIQILRHIPILWIWDNVEPVAGFPEGSESQWTREEQNDLRDFLKQIKLDGSSKVRILLTSRRDEQKWLGGIPYRIVMPRMRNSDAARLALRIGNEKNLSRSQTAAWQPLLDYCAGNPLTLRVLVGQAVKARLSGQQQIADFVETIRSGEQQIEDADQNQGRDKSLGASLNYGFHNAFKGDELPIIALLHLFQGVVDVAAFSAMGTLDKSVVPELDGKTTEDLSRLLQRAADVGVLTPLGGQLFSIHPALPWFLHQLFNRYYNAENDVANDEAVSKLWIAAMATMGDWYCNEFSEGNRDVIAALELEEFNLLHARRLAYRNGLWHSVVLCMQGLHTLYNFHGRFAEWSRLVEEIRLQYCTPNYEPVAGREEYTAVLTYLVELDRFYRRDIPHAVVLQEKLVKFCRAEAEGFFEISGELTDDQQLTLNNFASSLTQLADLRAQLENSTCLQDYQEAIAIYRRIGKPTGEAVVQWNLANAYKNLPDIMDLDAAEAAYLRSLKLLGPNDNWGRSKCIRQLGVVHVRRLKDAQMRNEPEEVWRRHAEAAEASYLEALRLCPADGVEDVSLVHNNLGNLYLTIGNPTRARDHYELKAQLDERAGNRHGAGQARFNLALVYGEMAETIEHSRQLHLERARLYAEAALRDFASYGGRAAQDESDTRHLIERFDKQLSSLGEGR